MTFNKGSGINTKSSTSEDARKTCRTTGPALAYSLIRTCLYMQLHAVTINPHCILNMKLTITVFTSYVTAYALTHTLANLPVPRLKKAWGTVCMALTHNGAVEELVQLSLEPVHIHRPWVQLVPGTSTGSQGICVPLEEGRY